WVVIAAPSVVKAIAGYALTTLVAEPVPAKPTVVAYPADFIAAYSDEIESGREIARLGGSGGFVELAYEAVLAFGADTDELRATVDASAAAGALDITF